MGSILVVAKEEHLKFWKVSIIPLLDNMNNIVGSQLKINGQII